MSHQGLAQHATKPQKYSRHAAGEHVMHWEQDCNAGGSRLYAEVASGAGSRDGVVWPHEAKVHCQ